MIIIDRGWLAYKELEYTIPFAHVIEYRLLSGR